MMVWRQTIALFVDAYRELNAQKLFWVTLALTALVVLIMAALGIDEDGLYFFGWQTPLPFTTAVLDKASFYKLVFSNFGIGIWLSWAAAILALISTASIMPELVRSGAIDTLLSKPIGRVRLFLTKYATGLLFVTLQVGLFAVGALLVFGFRAGVWEPRLLLAVPIVVVFFSYLYSVQALLGLVTRSSVASLLITLLFWFLVFLMNAADGFLLTFRTQAELTEQKLVERIERMETNTERGMRRNIEQEQGPEAAEAFEPTDDQLDDANPILRRTREDLEQTRENLDARFGLVWWSDLATGVKTALPKTGETIALLERELIDLDEIDFEQDDDQPANLPTQTPEGVEISQDELNREMQERLRDRSVWWIVGTSLVFEAVVLGIGCLIFRRRDF